MSNSLFSAALKSFESNPDNNSIEAAMHELSKLASTINASQERAKNTSPTLFNVATGDKQGYLDALQGYFTEAQQGLSRLVTHDFSAEASAHSSFSK